jgi:hypothetical protein
MVAFSIFMTANLLLSLFTPINFNLYRFPYKGWAWWTFNDLKNHPEFHNVALLGSSLMVSAVSGADANFLNQPLDSTNHHGAAYFDKKLNEAFKGSFNTYNLSAPGQMPSDAYLTLKAMLNTAHRPDVVIYGVAPRDFIDSSMSNPTDTEPFRFLNRLVSTDDCASGLFRDPLGRLEWFINRNLYLSHHSLDIQMKAGDYERKFFDSFAYPPNGKLYDFWARNRLIPNYKAGEFHPLSLMVLPLKDSERTSSFKNNTAEYIERYQHPDRHTYSTQFYFLRKLVNLCQKERIELVLVNMPITKENIAVLKPMAYIKFITQLKQFAFDARVCAFDLNDFTRYQYNLEDYHDFVHLNAFGGFKFFDYLTQAMKSEPRIASALEVSGEKLERDRALAANPRIDITPDNVNTVLEKELGQVKLKPAVDAALDYEHSKKIGPKQQLNM